MRRPPRFRILSGVLLVGVPLLLRLAVMGQLRGDPFFRLLVVDARTNHEMAEQIATGNFDPHLPFWQPPLYPYFLAVLYKIGGADPNLARIVQIVLGTLSCLLIFRLGQRLFSRRAAWIAWAISGVYGPMIFFDLQLLNANLEVFLLLLALERITASGRGLVSAGDPRPRAPFRWNIALGGLLLGLAAINVATSLLIIPVVAAWLIRNSGTSAAEDEGCGEIRSEKSGAMPGRGRVVVSPGVRTGLVFLAAAALPILVVTTRNVIVSHEPVLISWNGGVNFWIGNNADYDSTTAIRPGRDWLALTAEPLRAGVKGSGASSAWFFRKSLDWIGSHPAGWARLLLYKTRLFLRGDEIGRNQQIYPLTRNSWLLQGLLWIHGLAFPFGVVLPLAAAGLVFSLRGVRGASGSPVPAQGAGLVALVAAALSAGVVAFFIAGRYRMPVVPIVILFAGEGAVQLAGRLRRSQYRMVGAAGVAAVVAAVLANTGLPPMPRHFDSDAYTDLGLWHLRSGDPVEAKRQFMTALESNPDNLEATSSLGAVLLQYGQADAAEPLFRKVLAVYPNDPKALTNLGTVYFYKGDLYRAGDYFRKMVELYPDYPNASRNLQGTERAVAEMERDRLGRDPEEFLLGLERAIREQPDNVFLCTRLVSMLESRGLRERALAVLRIALRARPDDPGLREMEDRIERAYDGRDAEVPGSGK